MTEQVKDWAAPNPPEHDPFKDGDQSGEAISVIEAGIAASKAKRSPYLEIQVPTGEWKRMGRFLNTKYFWDLNIDAETRRKIIADYTQAAQEYDAPEAELLAPNEEPEPEFPAVTSESAEEALPRITLPPTPSEPDSKPYQGLDWAKRASHDYDDDSDK